MTPDPRKSRLLNLLSGISDMSAEDEARLIEVFESQIGDDDVLENDQRDNLVLQIRNAIGHGEFDHEPEFLKLLNQAAVRAAQNTYATHDDQTPGIIAGASEHHRMESGTRIGDFEIVEFIAAGGMGAVYRAHQSGLDRIVALKLIRSAPQHRKAGVRFQQEMKAVGRLNHPNIVRALHAGDSDSGPYLALEFIDGENLSATIAKCGRLPITSACQIILQAAEGLRHAHAAGLIHRDIKPSNLIMTSDGVVKILDLGLARVDAEIDDRLTQEGQFMGTVDYMAPEQAGDAMQADQRSDIYSLGCTFYELLTGSPPFSSQRYKSAAAKIVAHSKDKPPDVSLFRTDVPERLRNIVLKMMAKEPDARFADCGQLIEALHDFLEEFRQNETSPQPMKTGVGANRRQSVGNGESSATGKVVRPEKTPVRGKREQLPQNEKKHVYSRSGKRVTIVAASLLIFCLLAWQIVVRTSQGTLIIEIPEGVNGVPVEITESDGASRHLTVSTEENAVRVALGKTQVRITDATLSDLNLEEGTLAVKRGENRIRISRKSHVKNQKTQAHASSEPPQNENSDSANDRIQAAVNKPIALNRLDPSLIPPAETLPGLPLDVVAVLDSRSLYPTVVQKSKLILHPSAELCFAGGQIWSLKTGYPIDSNLTMELAGTAFGHGGQVVFNGNKLYSLARSEADPDGWTIKAESVLSQSKMYNAAAFSVNDEWLVASVTSSRQLDVFHLTDDTYSFVNSIPLDLSDGVAVNSLQLLNNGRLHVYASSAGGYDEQEETLSAVLELGNPEAPALSNVQRTSGHWVFSAEGTVSVCREAAPGHALKIYEVENGELPVIEADGQYTDVTISGDGRTILGTNLSGVQMFTKHDGMWQQKIVPPGGFRLCLTVSFDGKTLVAASNQGALDVWSLTGDIATLINPSQPTRVSHLSISPDGRFVGLSGTGPGRVLRLDGNKPIELPISSPPNVDGEWSFSSDSKFAADPYQDHLWDLSGETSVSVPGHTTCVGHDILIDWPAGESSGEFLIARHSQSKLQRLPWKVDAAGFHTGAASAEWTLEHGIQLSNWSAHSRRYISRDPTDGTVFVWKLDSNSPKAINTCKLKGNPGTGDAEALSSSGNTAVSFGRSMDLVSWQFDPSNLDDVPREYRIPRKFVDCAIITPNDKYIVCAEGVTLTAYSVDLTMQPVSIRLPINIRSLKMHPDGIHVLTVNSNGTCFVVRIPALAD